MGPFHERGERNQAPGAGDGSRPIKLGRPTMNIRNIKVKSIYAIQKWRQLVRD